jgi:hypothetical protein
LWQQPGLFDQVNDRQADQFKCIHKIGFARRFSARGRA